MNFFSKLMKTTKSVGHKMGLVFLNNGKIKDLPENDSCPVRGRSHCLYASSQGEISALLREARRVSLPSEYMVAIMANNGLERYLYYPWPSIVKNSSQGFCSVTWEDKDRIYYLSIGVAVLDEFTEDESFKVIISYKDLEHDIRWQSDNLPKSDTFLIKLDQYVHIFESMVPFNSLSGKRDGVWVDHSSGVAMMTNEPPPEKEGYYHNNTF